MAYVVDVNLVGITWEDQIPVISFDDENSSSSSCEDLQDDAWMDLPSCRHSQECEPLPLFMLTDAPVCEDNDLSMYLGYGTEDPSISTAHEENLHQQQHFMDALYVKGDCSDQNVTLDDIQQDIGADALKLALCEENDDGISRESCPSTPSCQVSASISSQDCASSPGSSVTSGVWSCSDYEALSPWSSPPSPALPPNKSYQISKQELTATMSSTPIDHFLANWLAQQMTPNNTEQRQYNKSSNKPPESYLTLIAKAILSLPSHCALLSDIYSFCLDNYEYFHTAPKTWKNAVRHNLCVNECFIKNGQAPQGRGFYWSIHPACMQSFLSGDFRRKEARQLAVDMNKLHYTQHQNPSAVFYI